MKRERSNEREPPAGALRVTVDALMAPQLCKGYLSFSSRECGFSFGHLRRIKHIRGYIPGSI
jgi:hypothetical protein